MVLLTFVHSACIDDDNSPRSSLISNDVIGPVTTLAELAQIYRCQNGIWPASLYDVDDLAEALESTWQPFDTSSVEIPTSDQFLSLRFESVSDSLLLIHFDLAPRRVKAFTGGESDGFDITATV